MTHEQVIITGNNRTRAGKKAIARVQCTSYSIVDTLSRDTIRQLIYINIRAHGYDSIDTAFIIEDGIYESILSELGFDAPTFMSTYSMRAYRVVYAIKHSLHTIAMIGIDPKWIAQAPSDELDPRASASDKQQILARKNAKISRKVSKLYRCGKCGCNEISVREYQSRASDEASSYSMQCLNESCANAWRT